MKLDELRWGIIGCGDVCEVKSGPALYKSAHSKLVAVMRRDAGKAADFARRHNVTRHYADADQLIRDPEVNIVYIATPPGSHRDYALKVAAAGKACYVEKPMARTYEECTQMIEAFARRNLPLFVAYYRRGMKRFIKAKELMQSGAIGKITGVMYRMLRSEHRRHDIGWRITPVDSGGGLFLDIGSHTLDIIDFLLGPLTHVAGVARNLSGVHTQVEDTLAMSFSAGQVPGSASWNFASDVSDDLIRVYGTDGTLSLSTFGDDPVKVVRKEATEEFPFPRPAHVHQGLIETIVGHLVTGQMNCPSTGASAARTSKVMDDVLCSFYGPREKLFGT